MQPAVELTEWPNEVWSVHDSDRRRHPESPDGNCAWVVQKWDTTDKVFYRWCLWHRSAACEDVQLIKAALGDTSTPNDDRPSDG